MKDRELSIDELLADVADLLDEDSRSETSVQPETVPQEPEEKVKPKKEKKVKKKEPKPAKVKTEKEPKPAKVRAEKAPKNRGGLRKFATFVGRLLLFLLETALILVIGLYGLMFVLAKGPSTTARDLFVMSVRETSAMGWVANIFFSDEEIAQIENRQEVEDFIEIDTSLIQIPKETEPVQGEEDIQDQGPKADAWGLIDEDGDGIILEEVKGEGYSGYMMVVLDPSRVIVGSIPQSYGYRGYTVAEMVQEFDAVAGINAGGFHDPNGSGNGSIPDAMVVVDGKAYYEHGSKSNSNDRKGFVGFDSNHIMHVGTKVSAAQAKEWDIQYGVTFGPVLITNGEPVDVGPSGVNPRTAVGQRSDGAILMLVIDGRQVISMGATWQDIIDIMMDYGAVNACNLDGGSSTLMWYDGDYVNNCASVIGIRPVPTAILVLKEGESGNG